MERGGCSDNWNVVEVQSRYRPVLCNAVAHTTCTIVVQYGTVCVAVLWYGMVSDGILWVGQHDGIFYIAFVSSGMVECGLVKTMVWVSVLSGNTTNSYQLKAGY